jgi:undecaprenyl-diphosphatase
MIEQLDHWLFFVINGRLGGLKWDWLDVFFLDLSALGSWSIVLVLMAVLSREKTPALLRHLLAILFALAVFIPVHSGLKVAIGRDRPAKALKAAAVGEVVPPRCIERSVSRHKSFPSGHTALAFFTMVYAGMVCRPWRPWGLILAALVGLSRVYVGAHFPFDCVAGAALGSLGGWLAWRLFLRINRPAAQVSI